MEKGGAQSRGANAGLRISAQLYARTKACNLSARTLMSQNETRCACLAPAVMWECEYFCSLTGSLCNNCTGPRRFSWEAENENSTPAGSAGRKWGFYYPPSVAEPDPQRPQKRQPGPGLR